MRRAVVRLTAPLMAGAVLMMTASATPASATPSGDGRVLDGAGTGPGSLGRLGPLTELVIERLLVSDQVAAAKFGTGQPIDDPARERQELASVRQSATASGIDPDAAVAFFQQQITASKIVQQGLFDRWTVHPDQAPTTRPDLTRIRTELDRLTTQLLQQMVARQRALNGGLECRVDLDVAAATGEVSNHLDALHRRAFGVALARTCAA